MEVISLQWLRAVSNEDERKEASDHMFGLQKEVIELFLKYQPELLDSVTPDDSGRYTALHSAARETRNTALNTLLDHGANKDIKNNDGLFAYDLAACHNGFTYEAQRVDSHLVDPISKQTLNRLLPTEYAQAQAKQRHDLIQKASVASVVVAIAAIGIGCLVYKNADTIKGWFKRGE